MRPAPNSWKNGNCWAGTLVSRESAPAACNFGRKAGSRDENSSGAGGLPRVRTPLPHDRPGRKHPVSAVPNFPIRAGGSGVGRARDSLAGKRTSPGKADSGPGPGVVRMPLRSRVAVPSPGPGDCAVPVLRDRRPRPSPHPRQHADFRARVPAAAPPDADTAGLTAAGSCSPADPGAGLLPAAAGRSALRSVPAVDGRRRGPCSRSGSLGSGCPERAASGRYGPVHGHPGRRPGPPPTRRGMRRHAQPRRSTPSLVRLPTRNVRGARHLPTAGAATVPGDPGPGRHLLGRTPAGSDRVCLPRTRRTAGIHGGTGIADSGRGDPAPVEPRQTCVMFFRKPSGPQRRRNQRQQHAESGERVTAPK